MTLCGTVMSADDFGQPLLVASGVALAASDRRAVNLRENVGQRVVPARGRQGGEPLANNVGFRHPSGERFLLNPPGQNIRQPYGQSFHGPIVRQMRQSRKTIIFAPSLCWAAG